MRALISTRPLLCLATLVVTAGCAVGGYTDAGTPAETDAGSTPRDAGATPRDAGSTPRDAGDVPAIDAGARDGGPPLTPDAGPAPAACATALAATRNGFEIDATDWTHGVLDGVVGSWPFDPWQWGTPSGGQPACSEGSLCLATDIDENYAQCGRGFLESAAFDLSECAGQPIALVMDHRFDFWEGIYGGGAWFDGGMIEVSGNDGATWVPIDASSYTGTIRINPDRGSSYSCVDSGSFYVDGQPGFVGTSSGWQTVTLPLPASVEGSSALRVRFLFSSGVSSETTNSALSRSATAPGWFIDDLRVEAR